MNACKEYAAGRIWLRAKLGGREGGREEEGRRGGEGGIEGGMVYRWAWGSGGGVRRVRMFVFQ